MYEKIKIFLLFLFVTIFQTSLSPNVFFGHIAPDIVLIIIIILSVRKQFSDFWFWAILAGVILDVMMMERIGVTSIIFLLIFLVINFISNRFFISQRDIDFFSIVIFIIIGTIINYIGIEFMLNIIDYFSLKKEFNLLEIFSVHNLFYKNLNNFFAFIIIYWPITRFESIFSVEKNKLIVK